MANGSYLSGLKREDPKEVLEPKEFVETVTEEAVSEEEDEGEEE